MDRDSCLTPFSPPSVHFLVRHVRLQSVHFQNQFPQLHCSVFYQQANDALFNFKSSPSDRTDCSSGKALNLYFGGSWLESRRNTSCPDGAFIFLSPSGEFLDYEHFNCCHSVVLFTVTQQNSNIGLLQFVFQIIQLQ